MSKLRASIGWGLMLLGVVYWRHFMGVGGSLRAIGTSARPSKVLFFPMVVVLSWVGDLWCPVVYDNVGEGGVRGGKCCWFCWLRE